MTDMPKGIWATPMCEDLPGGTYCVRDERPNGDAAFYIRADDPAMAARVLLEAMDENRELRNQVWQATGDAPGEFGKWFAAALRTIAEEG